jgi:hypothetical protein
MRAQALDLALRDAGAPRTAVDGYVSMGGLEDLRFLGLTPSFNVGTTSAIGSMARSMTGTTTSARPGFMLWRPLESPSTTSTSPSSTTLTRSV